MEEEIKIGGKAEVGYMGGSKWTGCNSTGGYMRYSEINKIVKKAFMKKYPETKVSCSGKSFSGGQECNGVVFMKESEILKSYDEFVKSGYCPVWHTWYYIDGKCIWGESPELTNEMRLKATYENYKKCLHEWCGVRMERADELDKAICKPEILERAAYLNDLYDSFNSYDINGMVDYFDVNFYKDVYVKAIDWYNRKGGSKIWKKKMLNTTQMVQ